MEAITTRFDAIEPRLDVLETCLNAVTTKQPNNNIKLNYFAESQQVVIASVSTLREKLDYIVTRLVKVTTHSVGTVIRGSSLRSEASDPLTPATTSSTSASRKLRSTFR